jgi:hypothetical protein
MAMLYLRQENDILNKIWYNHEEVKKMDRMIFDKEKNYLGCKSLGREGEFYVEDDKLLCRGEQIKAYHNAKGALFPKLDIENMSFCPEVKVWLRRIADYGQSVKICKP